MNPSNPTLEDNIIDNSKRDVRTTLRCVNCSCGVFKCWYNKDMQNHQFTSADTRKLPSQKSKHIFAFLA